MKFPQNKVQSFKRFKRNYHEKFYHQNMKDFLKSLPRYKKLFANHSNRNSYFVNQISIHLFGFADIKG